MTSEDLKNKFFQGMSYAAATVNVITTDGPHGRAGVTVSAMSSVSADTPKPTLLVCINENSSAAEQILANGVFCVNILRDRQSYISDVFAGRYRDDVEDKFSCTEWKTLETGAPCVADALVAFDCRIVSVKKVGTHHVIFGEVADVENAESGSALVYANRSYSAAQPIRVPASVNFKDSTEENYISIGCYHTFAPFFVPKMVKEFTKSGQGLSVNLVEGSSRRIKEAVLSGEVELALLFDNDLGSEFETTTLAELTPYILLSEDNPLTKYQTIKFTDLHHQRMISMAETSVRESMELVFRQLGVEPHVVFQASSYEMMRGMVGNGLGFGLVLTKPKSMTSYDGMPLIARKLDLDVPAAKVVLAYRRGAKLSPAANKLLSDAREVYEF